MAYTIQDAWGTESNSWSTALPVSVLFLNKPNHEDTNRSAWVPFPHGTVELLQAAFQRREEKRLPHIIVEIDHAISVIDFTDMKMFDQRSKSIQSIAWMDLNGKWFFPRNDIKCGKCSGMVTRPSFYVVYQRNGEVETPFFPRILPDLNQELPEWWY